MSHDCLELMRGLACYDFQGRMDAELPESCAVTYRVVRALTAGGFGDRAHAMRRGESPVRYSRSPHSCSPALGTTTILPAAWRRPLRSSSTSFGRDEPELELVVATTLEEALSAIERAPFALILMDAGLPLNAADAKAGRVEPRAGERLLEKLEQKSDPARRALEPGALHVTTLCETSKRAS